MSSRFGLYYFGLALILAAQFAMSAVYAANRLGEPVMPIPVNAWTVFGTLAGAVVLDLIDMIVEAVSRSG